MIDLAAVTFMDSTGLHALLAAREMGAPANPPRRRRRPRDRRQRPPQPIADYRRLSKAALCEDRRGASDRGEHVPAWRIGVGRLWWQPRPWHGGSRRVG
ncbi:MAG: STAS domain-containing protein [Solirubrobacteraceae bacterium]